jgi:hypothetical protein
MICLWDLSLETERKMNTPKRKEVRVRSGWLFTLCLLEGGCEGDGVPARVGVGQRWMCVSKIIQPAKTHT